jgi:amidase
LAASVGRDPGALRIAVSFSSPTRAPVTDEVRRAVEDVAAALGGLGHKIGRADPDYSPRAGGLLSDVGQSLILRYLRGGHDDALGMAHPERLMRRTKQIGFLGGLISKDRVMKDRANESAIAARANRVFDSHDVLLTPTVTAPPIEVGRFEGRGAVPCMLYALRGFGAAFTNCWNVTGNPAASVPAGVGEHGLPLSVQLVGRPGDEATLIALACQLEAERPWAHLRPPVS